MLRTILLCFLLLTCGLALADEASVRKGVEDRFPQAKIQSVSRTPYGGLYEVYMDGKMHYTDEKVGFVMIGELIDTKTSQNVTEQRMRKLTALNLKELPPLSAAIKRVKGDGRRTLMVFSDPMCPYCKRLEQELAKLNNVTIYWWLYPVENKFPGSTELAKQIWCAPDRGKAWDDLMLKGQRPTGNASCANPIADIDKIGSRMNISVTPTLVFVDGAPYAGMLPAAAIERLLTPPPQ